MRLLFVSHSLPPEDRPLANVGGMQRVALELHNALALHPEIEMIPLVLRSAWNHQAFTVPPYMAGTMATIARMARRREVDVVLFSSMVTAALAVPLRRVLRRHGIAAAAIVHGLDVTMPNPLYQRWVPRVFEALDAVLPVSRATGVACMERGLSERKLGVVPNGVNLGRFAPLGHPAAMRREMIDALADLPGTAAPESGLLLCSVGRQVPRKGFARFVDEVMPLLPDDVHYWLAGDGPEHENIRAAAERRGLQNRVRLLGRVTEEQLARLYRGADLFVMPNVPVPGDMEGFGVVMLEANLCGLPVVASSLEGIRDVIAEGENGHLVRAGDTWGFSEAIMQYYHERERLEDAQYRAAAYTSRTFGWDAVADRYVETLAEFAQEVEPMAPAPRRVRRRAARAAEATPA